MGNIGPQGPQRPTPLPFLQTPLGYVTQLPQVVQAHLQTQPCPFPPPVLALLPDWLNEQALTQWIQPKPAATSLADWLPQQAPLLAETLHTVLVDKVRHLQQTLVQTLAQPLPPDTAAPLKTLLTQTAGIPQEPPQEAFKQWLLLYFPGHPYLPMPFLPDLIPVAGGGEEGGDKQDGVLTVLLGTQQLGQLRLQLQVSRAIELNVSVVAEPIAAPLMPALQEHLNAWLAKENLPQATWTVNTVPPQAPQPPGLAVVPTGAVPLLAMHAGFCLLRWLTTADQRFLQ
jgi:hypothetical protein